MAAAIVPQSARQTTKVCPKCATRIENFSVDTNCSFRMCSNVSCTWPFDSKNLNEFFEHDTAVPSIRKRAKKRKAHSKEERLKKRRHLQKLPEAQADTLGNIEWLTKLCDGPQLSQGNYNETQLGVSGSQLLGSTANSQSNETASWLESLFQTSPTDTKVLTMDNSKNVADLFAALESNSLPDDAVIPQTSRQPSPTTNSDSADDDAISSDLAMLIGTKSSMSDPNYLDSLSMLLSPPASADAAKSTQLSMLDPNLWSSAAPSLAKESTQSFDLSGLFTSEPAATRSNSAFAPDAISPLDTNSIVENLFGKVTPSTL
ncbi:hypothetical protein EV183_002003 [Coemansia sp. RSA 2336]|nr:hypothetical protein EV183_002003 [Coemansia sp. RSA 2336]